MDWRGLVRNPWAWGGVVVAAAAGAATLWRRRAGSSSPASPAPAATGYSGGPGSLDTTATDVAGWLGQYQAAQQSQLNEFGAKLSDTLDALAAAQQTSTGAGTPPSSGGGTSTAGTGRYVTVKPYTTTNTAWESTLGGIARHENTTVAALLRLNPSISNPNVVRTGQRVRVA